MNRRWAPSSYSGFTIVELLIVIVVIGILATIVIVAFNGIQSQAAASAAKNSLQSAAKAMEVAKATTDSYPTTLPPAVKSTDQITLSLVNSTLPYYSGVNTVQNGVLLSQICDDLIAEGAGRGLNAGGGTDTYISGCGNWNAGSMQVTGWTSRVFNVPINATTFSDYAASIPAGGSYHPNQQSVTRNFYLQMQSRLVSQGGSFPVTSFWDSWASPGNGVMKVPLPVPTPNGNIFCIQAVAKNGSTWNIRPSGSVATGAC